MQKDKQLIAILILLNVLLIGVLIYLRFDSVASINSFAKINEAYRNQLIYQRNTMLFQLYSDGTTLDSSLYPITEKIG